MGSFIIAFLTIALPLAFWVWIIWLIVRASKKKKAAKLAQAEMELTLRLEAEQRRQEEEERDRQRRIEYAQALINKYGVETAKRIAERVPMIGDTEDIIIEMFGKPADIDTKQTAKKATLTYKYAQKTKTQFGLILKFDEGVLVEWEDKR